MFRCSYLDELIRFIMTKIHYLDVTRVKLEKKEWKSEQTIQHVLPFQVSIKNVLHFFSNEY